MKKKLLLLFCILIMLTGCWDREDIEARAYVLGIAVDEYPPIPKGQGRGKEEAALEEEKGLIHMQLHEGEPAYAMSIQIPIIKKARLISQGQSGGGGGGEGSRNWELVQVGNSFSEMDREFGSRLSQSPYYGHLQSIIISDKLAEKGIEQILDFFRRNQEIRRRTKLFISDGEAKRVLDVMPRIEDFSAIYISKITAINSNINSRIAHKSDLGEVYESISSDRDFILPRVTATKDEIKDTGAAVFRDNKMVGWISGVDMESVKFIKNLYLGGVITAKKPGTSTGVMALDILNCKSRTIPGLNGNKPEITVEINAKGSYAEQLNGNMHSKLNIDTLREIEKVFEEKIENQCSSTVKGVQQKYNADIFDFCELLRTKMPDYWESEKSNWHKIFPQINVKIKVRVSIRESGEIT